MMRAPYPSLRFISPPCDFCGGDTHWDAPGVVVCDDEYCEAYNAAVPVQDNGDSGSRGPYDIEARRTMRRAAKWLALFASNYRHEWSDPVMAREMDEVVRHLRQIANDAARREKLEREHLAATTPRDPQYESCPVCAGFPCWCDEGTPL